METHMEDEDQFQFCKRLMTYLNIAEAELWRQNCSWKFLPIR